MTDPRLALSSNPGQVEPGPFSEHELREQWNAQADPSDPWDESDLSEKLAWAQTRAIASVQFPRLARLMQEPTAFELGELPPPAAAKPVNLAELHDPDFSGGLTPSQHLDVLRGGPDPRTAATASPELPKPETERILKLAEIIREADPADRIGGWSYQLAQALLAHPGFSGCHDGPVAPPVQGEVGESEQPIEWVVNSYGELGVSLRGRHFFFYKGRSLEYSGEDAEGVMVRPVGKREFGEVCRPLDCLKVENGILYDRTPLPYVQELFYIPGLSDGQPGDFDWRPLPSPPITPNPPP